MFGLTTVIAVLCVITGIVLARITWWFWSEARPESPALAPLEIMSEKTYLQANEVQRGVLLDAVRMSADTVPQKQQKPQKPQKPQLSTPKVVAHKPASQQLIDPLLK